MKKLVNLFLAMLIIIIISLSANNKCSAQDRKNFEITTGINYSNTSPYSNIFSINVFAINFSTYFLLVGGDDDMNIGFGIGLEKGFRQYFWSHRIETPFNSPKMFYFFPSLKFTAAFGNIYWGTFLSLGPSLIIYDDLKGNGLNAYFGSGFKAGPLFGLILTNNISIGLNIMIGWNDFENDSIYSKAEIEDAMIFKDSYGLPDTTTFIRYMELIYITGGFSINFMF